MSVNGQLLRGRDDEIDVVTEYLTRASGGGGGVLIVEGGAGIGKSSLVAHAAMAARNRSFGCGFASADPDSGGIDMAVLMEALVGGDPPLIDPDLLAFHGAPADQRFWLLQELQVALERLALQHPLLICLDDLHWSDIGSAFGLRVLSQWLNTVPVCWILATRPGQGHPALQRTLSEFVRAGARTLTLSGLDADAVVQITRDILGAAPSGELLEAIDQVEGNPFLLVDLLTGLREDGQLTIAGGMAAMSEYRPPRRWADGVRVRLARLSPVGERAAILAASLGRRFSPTELAALSGLSVSDLVEPVQELLRSGVFTECVGHLQFQHDLLREAIRTSIPTSMRRALDREAADALLATGALPVEVAGQLAESAELGDEVAIGVLSSAAEALAATDPQASADIAASALELAPAWHPLRGPLVARRTLSLFATGRRDEASEFANTVLSRSMPAEQEAELRLGISCMFSLCADVRAENARSAMSQSGVDSTLRIRAAASLYHSLSMGGRIDEAITVASELEGLVIAADDDTARYSFDVAGSTVEYQRGRFELALRLLDEAELRRRRTVDDTRQRLAHHYRSWILTALDRFDEAATNAHEGLASAHRDRQAWAVHIFETWQGRNLVQLGNLEDAVAVLEGRYCVEDSHRLVGVVDAAAAMALGRARLHLGDERGAAEIVSIAEVLSKAGAPGNRRLASWFLALDAMANRDPDRAHSWLCALGEQQRLDLFPLFPHEATDDIQLMRIALAVGDDELAHRTMSLARKRLELNPSIPTIAAVVAHCEGLLEGRAAALRQAVSNLEDGPRRLALATALEDLGCAHLRDGSREDAVKVFDRALVLNTETGALRDAARVRRRLRELGVRRRVLLLDRPKTGPRSLTDAELRVAQLVADGCTNRAVADRLFVSPHTVNTHLRHVFEKLAINSRMELGRLMAGTSDLEDAQATPRSQSLTLASVTPVPRRPESSTPAYRGRLQCQ